MSAQKSADAESPGQFITKCTGRAHWTRKVYNQVHRKSTLDEKEKAFRARWGVRRARGEVDAHGNFGSTGCAWRSREETRITTVARRERSRRVGNCGEIARTSAETWPSGVVSFTLGAHVSRNVDFRVCVFYALCAA